MDNKKILINKYVELVIESEKNFLDSEDVKANKYNKIAKQLYEFRNQIKVRDDYKEIYIEILDLIKGEKYWQMYYDLAESIYLQDKLFSLEIYKMHKGRSKAYSRIQELENELREEGKLPKKGLLSKLFE